MKHAAVGSGATLDDNAALTATDPIGRTGGVRVVRPAYDADTAFLVDPDGQVLRFVVLPGCFLSHLEDVPCVSQKAVHKKLIGDWLED